MSPTARKLSFVLAILGLGASIAAGYVHYRLLFDPRYASFCDISSTINCAQVYQSRYAVFHGVPVALLGAIWFGAALLLVGCEAVAPAEVRVNVPGYLFALSTIGLAVIFYMGYVSFFILKAVCLLCITTYAAVIGLFLISGVTTSFPMITLPRRAARDVRAWSASPLAITITILFLAGAASAVAFFPRDAGPGTAAPAPTRAQQSEIERFMASEPRVPLVIPRDGAKVLIVKFHDYQCAACVQAYMTYKPILAKYDAEQPGAVRLVSMDYPLSSGCNPYVPAGGPHPAACEAAVAARLAREHRRGAEMEEWLFSNHLSLTPPIVRQAARDVGQIPDFDERYQTTLVLVRGDVELGHQLGVRATPTFFINGVKVEGTWLPQYLDQAIAFELRRAAGGQR